MTTFHKMRPSDPALLAGVFFVVALTYALLIAEVPVDDEAAFVARVTSQTMAFDLAYPWLLPVLRLAVDGFESIATPLTVLKAVNIIAASVGFSIFALTLRRSGLSMLVTGFTILFAALSFNFLSLAPTGHPKMLSFPFLCGAFHCAMQWERQRELESRRMLFASALLLGLSSLFLVNGLAVIPFGMAAIILRQRNQDRPSGWNAIQDAMLWAFFTVGVFFLGVFLAAFVEGLRPENLAHLLDSKNASGGSSEGLAVMLARAVFATVFGVVGLQGVGSTIRAIMAGYVDERGRALLGVLPALLIFLSVGAAIFWVYFCAITRLFARETREPFAFPLAFVAGFVVFGIYWQLNEAEFWYQIIVPTYLMAAILLTSSSKQKVAAILMALVVVYNLLYFSIPRRSFPLHAYEESVAERYAQEDLVLYFSAYPGRPTFSFISAGATGRLSLDALFFKSKTMENFLRSLNAEIDRSLGNGGIVHVFEAFDEDNWDAPWLALMSKGFDRAAFMRSMHERYCIRRVEDQYTFKVWTVGSGSDRANLGAGCERPR